MNKDYIYIFISMRSEEFIIKISFFIYNGAANQFVYYTDDNFSTIIELKEAISYIQNNLRINNLATIYAKKEDKLIRIELYSENTELKIYPLMPYKLKKIKDSNKELIDLSEYIKLSLEFCENFPLNDFYSKQID